MVNGELAVAREAVSPGDGLAIVSETITGRRSIKAFVDRPVPRELVERLLELATWAPNHRLNHPWRFYVLTGSVLEAVGQVAAAVTREKLGSLPGADPLVVRRKADEVAAAWSGVPMLVYLTVLTHAHPATDLENYGAGCCAAQNLMLAAHAAGLASSWSTGAVAAADALRELVGAGSDERMIGLFRLGYPDRAVVPPVGRRKPAADFTLWVAGNA